MIRGCEGTGIIRTQLGIELDALEAKFWTEADRLASDTD
jgi:hypothetical protein